MIVQAQYCTSFESLGVKGSSDEGRWVNSSTREKMLIDRESREKGGADGASSASSESREAEEEDEFEEEEEVEGQWKTSLT